MDPLAVLAEQWLAAMGITVFLASGKVRLDKSVERTVQRMEDDVRATFKRFAKKPNRFVKRDEDEDSGFARSITFEKLADDLYETADPKQLMRRLEGFPPDLMEPLALAATRTITYLRDRLPVTRYQGGMGLRYRDPSPRDKERFWRAFDVADAPLSVLATLEAGELAGDQVDTLRECYVNLYSRWQELALQELTADDLSLSKEKQWRLFMSTLSYSPDIAAHVKQLAEAGEAQDKGRGGGAPDLGIDFYGQPSDKLAAR